MHTLDNDAPRAEPSPTSGDWDRTVSVFRALGGIAENVVLGTGSLGRGLFALDPTKPVLLRIPEGLMFAVDDVELVGERVRIRDSAEIGKPEREFFEDYENTLSWGCGGRSECAEFIAALGSLPSDVQAILRADFRMGDFLGGEGLERTWKWFLTSRQVERNGKKVLMPLVELANHGADGLSCVDDGHGRQQVAGTAADEILINYGADDAMGIFRRFGIASPQSQAFSFPMKTRVGPVALSIDSSISAYTRRSTFRVPLVVSTGNNCFLSHLMIGHRNNPRLSRGIFHTLLREAGVQNPDEAFDSILYFNRKKLLKLLVALEPYHGEIVITLRKVARYQLETMANCVGTREL